jgi:hypothetical protein
MDHESQQIFRQFFTFARVARMAKPSMISSVIRDMNDNIIDGLKSGMSERDITNAALQTCLRTIDRKDTYYRDKKEDVADGQRGNLQLKFAADYVQYILSQQKSRIFHKLLDKILPNVFEGEVRRYWIEHPKVRKPEETKTAPKGTASNTAIGEEKHE